MALKFAAVAILAIALSGCGNGSKPAQSSSVEKTAEADAPPPAPEHNYTSRDGKLYCYTGAISEDDRKSGAAASDIVCYKYLGESHGVQRFASDAMPGAIISCDTPCEVVKFSMGGTVVKRITFEPKSLVGAAIVDAMNGQLEAPAARAARTDDE